MRQAWKASKKIGRQALVRIIPSEVRRRIVIVYPWLRLIPDNMGEASAKFDASSWERFYANTDPYGHTTSDFEREKYQRTLDCIGEGPFERAVELGCSVGVFTALLAPRCKRLLGVEISQNAIKQARKRTAAYPQVEYERRVLPKHMPPGPFDLIVCSDVLFYWPLDSLLKAIRAFEQMLSPGGRLVTLHYTESLRPPPPLDGHAIHETLRSECRLENTFSHQYEKYRLDRFEKPA